jgi:hypothetical protein
VLLQQQRSGKQRQATDSGIKAITASGSGRAVQSRTVKNADASIEIGHYIKERAAKARYATLSEVLHVIATLELFTELTISSITLRADCSTSASSFALNICVAMSCIPVHRLLCIVVCICLLA